ncbi:MAG: hypothetical protein AAGF11_19670 [Myxococcota bacterium]
MLAFPLGVLGCHTANPSYDSTDGTAGDASGPTTTATSANSDAPAIDTTAANGTAANGTTTNTATADGPTTSDPTTSDPTSDPTETETGSIDECPSEPLTLETLPGIWWLCEFGINGQPPQDGCITLDNEGIRFDEPNELAQIRWSEAPMEECIAPASRCFHCAESEPEPEPASPPWGSWSVTSQEQGVFEILVAEMNEGCQSHLRWLPVPGEPYVRVESVQGDDGCGLIGLNDPGISPTGPWFMRSLER